MSTLVHRTLCSTVTAAAALLISSGPAAASLPLPEGPVAKTRTVVVPMPYRDREAETVNMLAAAAAGAMLAGLLRRRRHARPGPPGPRVISVGAIGQS
ncbi:hypothetical protein ACQP00_22400 [Dactylosporangium sp. CS-047395]|uniref:hypothetical protein n=1 Tax=Dactylosporangium sp. CS-047395 TaxID=3239936 RepID=UPI003D947CAE